MDLGGEAIENNSDIGWQNAITYQEKIKRASSDKEKLLIKKSAVESILRKAQTALGAVSRPYMFETKPWEEHPDLELDLETSLEADPSLNNLLVEKKLNRRAELVVCLDTSLSMTGEKLALVAVSIAVLAMQLDPEDLSIINFASSAELIKPLQQNQSVSMIVERFLESPAKGLTNMEAALKLAQKEMTKAQQARRAVILMSDGKFTAGGRPDYLVPSLPKLHVVQTGSPWSNSRFFKNLANIGNGKFLHVSDFSQLPRTMYSLVHEALH